MSKRKLLAILCAIAMLVTTIPADTAEAAAKKSTLALDKTSCVMKKGTKMRLKVTGSLIGFNGKLKWSTSNWKVAVVTPRGVVIARKKGTTVIKVKAGGQKATCKITVGTPVKKIKASKKSLTLKVGKTAKLTTSVSPRTASVQKLIYTTKNKRVATVSKKGVVKGIATGSTQVTVQSTDGSGKSAKVKVKVQGKKKKQTQPPINLTVNPVINVMLPTPVAGQTTTGTPNSVSATGITLSDTEKELNINEEAQLTAAVLPADATNKTVTWASSNTEVATVSKSGLVTPEGEGEVEITASTADGKHSAKCTVTVIPTAVVSTNKEIAHALTKKNLKRLEIESSTSKMLTVPEGIYSNVEMVVNLPNGELENYGVFQGITIEEIAEDTYFEKAIGNIIKIASKKAHIIVDENAETSIILSKENKDTSIENNGIIKKLEVNTKGNVEISGLSKEKISVDIKAEVTISSTLKLDINATSRFNITVRPGAESTEITVDVEANMPNIFGLGIISVKITATGEIKNIVSENTGADNLAQTVKITGSVRDAEGAAIEGVQIYIARYTGNDYDVENIWSDRDAVRLITDAKGEYTTNNKVKAGNYYLAARKDGFMDLTCQIVVISSSYGDTYTNEEITMIPADWAGKTGNVTGKVLDSTQKDLALKDIAVRLKRGKGNMDSQAEILKETRTDAGGEYRFDNLEVGYYTIEFVDDKTQVAGGEAYLTTWINVLIRPDETVIEGAIMSKSLKDKQLRFILKWGSEESGAVADLDAHLTGPTGYDGNTNYERFHTYFQNKQFDNGNEEGKSHADLDVDDMDYKGPETTTIYESVPGVYSYYIHDYTNSGSQESDKLSNSSVSVEVYIGNLKQNTYYIPKKPGTVWHVFDYDSTAGILKAVNTMYYETESSYVGNTVAQYQRDISQNLKEIEEYQKSLEEGTGADISEKITAYRQRLNALTEGQEGEAAKLRYETREYKWELFNECDLYCSAKGIYSYSHDGQNAKATFTINASNTQITAADIHGSEGVGVTEVTPTKQDAWKAFRVVAKSGHVRIIHVYLKYALDIKNAKIGEEELVLLRGNGFTNEQGDINEYLYIYSQKGTDFALSDIQFAYTTDEKNVTRDSKKIDGEYTITMQSDSEAKTWIIRKLSSLKITDPENKIYKIDCSGGYIDVYADNKLLNGDCVLVANGKQYELTKEKSGTNYSRYHVFVEGELNLWIDCYAIEDVCTLKKVYFNQNVEAGIDQETKTVTVTAMSENVKAEELSLSGVNTLHGYGDVKTVYKEVDGEDYVGKITVTVNGVTDYSNEYKVYFKSYQPPTD